MQSCCSGPSIGVARHQIIFGLQHLVARQPLARRDGQRLGEPLGAVIGGAERAHLARLHQRVEGGERVGERRLRVVLMGVIEVDMGAEPLERGLGGRGDPRRLQLLAALARQHADLGRDQHVVAPPRRFSHSPI